MFETDHKTIFILDHGPAMGESSKQMVDFDTKSRPQGVVPLAPVAKSLWSNSMEALCEYCRVVWDIFPSAEKLLRFVIADSSAKFLNSWNPDEQNINYLMQSLSSVGIPLKTPECSVLLGLVSAVEGLCEVTEAQKKHASEGYPVSNKGRIVCITQLKNDIHLKTIIDCICDAVSRHCDAASRNDSDTFLAIDRIEVVLMHVKQFGADNHISERRLTPLPEYPKISLEVQVVKATRHGTAIANRLLHLVCRHYDLSVTSITGIPMKEEQHANSSANYDVLLLHRRLPGTPLSETEQITWDGELNSTMLLKWCTPKISVNELYHCTGAARISPVDVNSRPSLCLTNFLLNGRSVLLEHWIKWPDGTTGSSSSGVRQMTHMISCRGSDIFLHALGRNRPPFEDPPSISDCAGGKVTDYRINDFSEIMKQIHLLPLSDRIKSNDEVLPLDGATSKLHRLTRCFPVVFSRTIIFNLLKVADPLLQSIVKISLTPDDVMNCQRVIYYLIGLEREGTALPLVTSSANRGSSKQNRKDEQYKSMWKELEELLQAHSGTSNRHMEVLDCLLECLGRNEKNSGDSQNINHNKSNTKLATTEVFESPESPPPMKKQKLDKDVTMNVRPQKGTQSLLNMWIQRVDTINSQRHVEFYGRLTSDGNKARLYPNIEEDSISTTSATNQDRSSGRHHHHRFPNHHRAGSNNRDEGGRSGRNTPQGKQKMTKNNPKRYTSAS